MKGKKHTFTYKIKYDLSYRLMTAVFVFILPVCVIGCILLGIVWDRTKQEVQYVEQGRLEDVMAYWERDCSAVDNAMEYFVTMFLEELNYDRSKVEITTPYRMFSQLERVLTSAEHNGLVALRDNHTGQILAQMQDPLADAATLDSQVQGFVERIMEDDLTDASWQKIGGHYYLLKRFDYRNNSVFFALDIENSIRERTAFSLDQQRRHLGLFTFLADGVNKGYCSGIADLLNVDIGAYHLQFLLQGNQIIIAAQGIAEIVYKMQGIFLNILKLLHLCQRVDSIQRIQQHMGIHLQAQIVHFCLIHFLILLLRGFNLIGHLVKSIKQVLHIVAVSIVRILQSVSQISGLDLMHSTR